METATTTPNAPNALALDSSSYAFAYVEFERTRLEISRYEAQTGDEAPGWMYRRLFAREDALKAFGEVIA